MRLIDADKLIKDISEKPEHFGLHYITIVELQPTVERPKGEWIFTKTNFDKCGFTVECPSCHKKWKTYDEIRWKKENKFCPNCGSEMEGVAKNATTTEEVEE